MKAIISGATRGIGLAIAQKLATSGYDLILLARTNQDLTYLKNDLKTTSNSIQTAAIDLSKKGVVEILKNAVDLTGSSLLINNLGSYEMDHAINLDVDLLQKQLEVNLFSAIQLTNLIHPYLVENENSMVVNIGSVMSLSATSAATSYSISKHAFKAWNDALREELRIKKIKVSCIYPGSVNTSSWDGIDANRDEMIQPKDIANLIELLTKMNQSSLIEEIRISPMNFGD